VPLLSTEDWVDCCPLRSGRCFLLLYIYIYIYSLCLLLSSLSFRCLLRHLPISFYYIVLHSLASMNEKKRCTESASINWDRETAHIYISYFNGVQIRHQNQSHKPVGLYTTELQNKRWRKYYISFFSHNLKLVNLDKHWIPAPYPVIQFLFPFSHFDFVNNSK
jgi:hypothetical protein